MTADARSYRSALGHFATGVAVVSGLADDAAPCGVTINSFTSVSLDPRIILFSLIRGAPSLECFAQSRPFAISVLSEFQAGVSRHFATRASDKWRGVEQLLSPRGCPIVAGTLAAFGGVVESAREVGDHVVVFGLVEHVEVFRAGEPLLFFRGQYGGIRSTRPALGC